MPSINIVYLWLQAWISLQKGRRKLLPFYTEVDEITYAKFVLFWIISFVPFVVLVIYFQLLSYIFVDDQWFLVGLIFFSFHLFYMPLSIRWLPNVFWVFFLHLLFPQKYYYSWEFSFSGLYFCMAFWVIEFLSILFGICLFNEVTEFPIWKKYHLYDLY